MTFLKAILFLVPIFTLSYLTDYLLRRVFKTERRSFWAPRHVNSFQTNVTLILVGMAAIFSFISNKTSSNLSGIILPIVFFIIFAFRVYMEWKHDRSSKEYIITLFSWSWFIIFVAGYGLIRH